MEARDGIGATERPTRIRYTVDYISVLFIYFTFPGGIRTSPLLPWDTVYLKSANLNPTWRESRKKGAGKASYLFTTY